MELQTLQNFIVIAETGNISKAAQILHLSQPTLSRQLQNLETELGVILAKRSSRRLNLTNDGFYLLQRAQEIVSMVDKTKNDLNKEIAMSGNLYIGCGETQGVHIIAQVIKIMYAHHPQIHFQLFSGSGDDLRYKMKSGFLDFSLLLDPTNMEDYNFISIPYNDKWGLLINPTNSLAANQVIHPSDVDNLPAIFPQQHYNFNQLENWFGHPIDHQTVIGTYNLLFNASMLVQEDVSMIYCINNLINTTAISNLVFRPLKPTLLTKINFVWLKNRPLSNAAKYFLETLKKVVNTNV